MNDEMSDVKSAIVNFFQESSNPVVFCGAGVSAHAGIPAWRDYLLQLAELIRPEDAYTRHQMVEAIEDEALEDAAGYYFMSRKIRDVDKYERLVRPLNSYNATALDDIIRLPSAAFVTPNFDRSLFDAYGHVRDDSPVDVHYGDATIRGAAFYATSFIARIHGRAEVPEEILLTREALQKAAEDDAYGQFLQHLLTRRQILFVGFSFLDPAIRTILNAVREVAPSIHEGRHVALLPSNVSGGLDHELERYSIRQVRYNADEHHSELWQQIKQAADELNSTEVTTANEVSLDPFYRARRFIATCYARNRMRTDIEPLWRTVVEGVVSALLVESEETGTTGSTLYERVSEEFGFPSDRSRELVDHALRNLEKDGLCSWKRCDGGETIVPSGNHEGTYDQAIQRLADGLTDRVCVREDVSRSDEIRACTEEFFHRIVLERGWDLGAAFAGHQVPQQPDVQAVLEEIGAAHAISSTVVDALVRSAADFLTNPDNEEARLLAELGRIGFAMELLVQAPHDSLFHESTLPETIYLDANVLMPAIVEWHPFSPVYRESIDALRRAVSGSRVGISIAVYYGFVNETVSHRRLASERLDEIDEIHWQDIQRQIRIFGHANTNVFIGAYANYVNNNGDMEFDEFLGRFAPYTTESELREYLARTGIEVVRDRDLLREGNEYPGILHQLEIAYANQLEYKRKSGVVIEHDAKQMAGVELDIRGGRKTIFVTADRTLREAIDDTPFSHISNAMVSHVGLAQLIDLLVGGISESRGFANLIWGASVSSDTERIRNYLVDRALDEHDAAVARSMHSVVDDIAEDAGFELNRQRLSLSDGTEEAQEKVSGILRGYEEKFFRLMREEMERQDAQ